MVYAFRGFVLGLLMSLVLYLIERTTGQPAWLLIVSPPICWTFAGYLFWRLDIGGYRSEREK